MKNKWLEYHKNDEKRQFLLERRYELEMSIDGTDISATEELKSLNREREENERELNRL